MQLFNTLLTLLPLTTLISAAPVPDSDASKQTFVVSVTDLPASVYDGPVYIVYAKNFFGDLELQPSKNKSAAVEWTISPKTKDLVSTTQQTISLTPPYARPQAQSINYVAYNGTQGTYVKDHKKVLNRSPDFGHWRFCESQYGAGLEYVTPGFNNTQANAGYSFPCYIVGFELEK